MNYQIGDPVIHLTYGPGKIIAIEEKRLAGLTCQYYVVDTGKLTLWVLVDEMGEKSMRPPAGSFEFKELLTILGSPSVGLSNHYHERKNQLSERMQKRILINICGVIRDLTARAKQYDLNSTDRSMLRVAQEYLLDEWELALGTARSSARKELDILLKVIP